MARVLGGVRKVVGGRRRAAFVAVGAVALVSAGFALSQGMSAALVPSGPNPQTVTIGWGDTITFTNTDTVAHGLTSPLKALSAPTIAPGGTFTTALTGHDGTYGYRQTGGRSKQGSVVLQVTGTV